MAAAASRIRIIGEMSMPPRLGSMLRIGRSSGSVIRYSMSQIVATNWLRVLTTLKAISQLKTADAISSHV